MHAPEADDRPAIPSPPRLDWRGPAATAALLGLVVYWLLAPLWPDLDGQILGDPETDTLRGLWGLDHVRRSILPPDLLLWSREINFPVGGTALILPWVSALLFAPLGALFGPVVAWNLAQATLLWAAGMGMAALGRQLSGSWAAGAIAGSALIVQPMLLFSIADGTPEHLAIWSVPLFLAALHRALVAQAPRWGIAAGLLAGIVALDSPYHAVYAFLIGAITLPWALHGLGEAPRRVQLAWTLGAFSAVGGVLAVLVGLIYRGLGLSGSGEDAAVLLSMNATDLRTWWQYDFLDVAVREASMAPTNMPAPILWAALVLVVLGLPRSLPWALAGALLVVLSLGLNARLPSHLATWLGGERGASLGGVLLDINRALYALPGLENIRFPQRLLVPAALCFLAGGSVGLARLLRLPVLRQPAVASALALLLSGGAAVVGLQASRLDLGLAAQPVIPVQFAEWLAEQPDNAAIIHLPQSRPPPASGQRTDLPVFANIDDALTSADTLYFQAIHGRPMVGYPGLKTISAPPLPDAIIKLLRDWDDLTLPATSGREVPPSANDPRQASVRTRAIQELYGQGLRWIAVDLGVYPDASLAILREQLAGWIAEERTFNEGDGVLLLRLGAAASDPSPTP